jgi:hypothetical protein
MFYFTFADGVYLLHKEYGPKDRTNDFDEAAVFHSLPYKVRGKSLAQWQYSAVGKW